MPQNHSEKTYVGYGPVYLRERGAAAPMRYIGDLKTLTTRTSKQEISTLQHTSPGGGELNSFERIQSVAWDLVLQEFHGDNLALATQGGVVAVAAGSVVDETLVAYKGGYTKLAKIPSSLTAVTNMAGTTTYVAGTDYVLDGTTLYIPIGSTITDPVAGAPNLKVDYANKASTKVHALTLAAKEYELLFDGANEAQSGKRGRVTGHRIKIGSAEELGWISENHAELKLTGKALQDSSQPVGESQWFMVEFED